MYCIARPTMKSGSIRLLFIVSAQEPVMTGCIVIYNGEILIWKVCHRFGVNTGQSFRSSNGVRFRQLCTLILLYNTKGKNFGWLYYFKRFLRNGIKLEQTQTANHGKLWLRINNYCILAKKRRPLENCEIWLYLSTNLSIRNTNFENRLKKNSVENIYIKDGIFC